MEKIGSNGKIAIRLSLLLAVLYFTSYITRLNFSAAMTEMISVGVLNKTQAGIIGSALFFSYGFGQIISGMLSDRFSPYGIIGAGLGITVICNILMPIIGAPTLMAILWGFNGFAQALFWPPIVGIMAKYLDEMQYAKGLLWVSIGSHGATILIYVIVPAFLMWFDWRSAFWFAAVWAFLFAVLWIVAYPAIRRRLTEREAVPRGEEKRQPASLGNGGFLRTLAASGVMVLLIAIAMQGFLKDGVQSWMPTFFTEVFRMDSSLAILSNVLLPVFNIIVVYIATALYRRFFRDETKEALVLFAVATVLCVLLGLFFEGSAVLCLILAALITGCMHGINLMLICFLPRRFRSTGKVSTVSGICNAFSYVGSTASSYGIALIAEILGWRITLLSWGGIALVGLVLCAVCAKRWGAFVKENP